MKIASSPQNRRRLLYSVDRQLQRPTRRVIFPDNRQNVVVVSAFTPLAICCVYLRMWIFSLWNMLHTSQIRVSLRSEWVCIFSPIESDSNLGSFENGAKDGRLLFFERAFVVLSISRSATVRPLFVRSVFPSSIGFIKMSWLNERSDDFFSLSLYNGRLEYCITLYGRHVCDNRTMNRDVFQWFDNP